MLLIGIAGAVLAACGDAPAGPGNDEDGAFTGVVSDPVAAAGSWMAEAPAEAFSGHLVRVDPLAFVSAPPGTFPASTGATVKNLRSGVTRAIRIVDDGFDPVGIPATPGDALSITVARATGGPVFATSIVAARRPPRVVRTRPGRGRNDVSINATIAVIFSEPIDPRSLGGGGIRLMKGGAGVPGVVRAIPGSPVGIEFVPATPLDAGAAYDLVVDGQVKDLSGDFIQDPGTTEFTTTAAEPGSWVIRAAPPTSRGNGAVALVNGIVYAFGGTNSALVGEPLATSVEAYDPAADRWTTATPMPTPRSYLAGAALDGVVYAVGGLAAGGIVATVEAYDPATRTWSARTPMPTPRLGAKAVAAGGKLYVIGGYSNATGATGAVEVYDPIANAWTTRTPKPLPRIGFAAQVVGGVIYVLGGADPNGDIHADVHAYQPAADTWTIRASMPFPRAFLGATAVGGTLYAINGIFAGSGSGDASSYDPATDAWRSHSTMPRSDVGVDAVAVDGVIYAFQHNTLACTP